MQEMDRRGMEKLPRVKRPFLGRLPGAPTTPASKMWKALNENYDEVIMEAKAVGYGNSVVPPTPSARTITKSVWELRDLPLQDRFHACLFSPNFNPSPLDSSLPNSSPFSQPDYILSSPTSFKSDRHSKTTSLQRLLTTTSLDADDDADHDSLRAERKRYAPSSMVSATGAGEVESGHNLIMSQELLRHFSQIRILEEQHNESLNTTTAIHAKLMQAHAQVREIELPDRMARREVERLMETHRKEKMRWRINEKERIKAAVQIMKEELGQERREKNNLESANQKLAMELKEARAATAKALQELENERKQRQTIADVCHDMTNEKADLEQVRVSLEEERRMLQLAEVWREERVQMKLSEARLALETKSAALDVMWAELKSFLAHKQGEDPATFRDGKVLHDVISSVYDTSISTFPPTSSMSSNSSNSSFAPTSEYMYGNTLDTDSGNESHDHGHALLYYPEGIPDAD